MAWNAKRLDARAFAQARARLQADEPLARFERLHAEARCQTRAPAAPLTVRFQVQGELRPAASGGAPAVWLHLQAQTELPLTCQRCLEPVSVRLTVDRWFRLVADEASAAAEDDACEEDLLALEPRPNLHEVLEDELLMELPLLPLHDDCPQPLPMQAADPGETLAGGALARENPFAALVRVKK